MVFNRFVEIGRVALVSYGPLSGKLVVIVDIINTARVLIDGPTSNVRRQEISLKRLSLTDLKLDVVRGVKREALKKAITTFDLLKKWGETSWARKLHQRERRAQLTDFDRFKVKVLKQRRRAAAGKAGKSKK
jgi:large subunit ribosomal protein L14e